MPNVEYFLSTLLLCIRKKQELENIVDQKTQKLHELEEQIRLRQEQVGD